MAATNILFLLLLSALYISAVAAQQRSSKISLGSSLSASSNSSWLSSSGHFAFGFYPQEINTFAIGIWFAQIPEHTVVWTANRDDLPLSNKATLLLTSDGRFILQSTQDQEKLIANVSQSASWASMLDTGNFVLYDSSGEIIWQSFDSPTNTLLQGQRLLVGQELFSSVSETNDSNGIFRLNMQHDGNLVQYPIKTPDTVTNAYWASGSSGQGDNMTLNLDDGGHLYLVNSNGFTIQNLTTGGTPINKTVVFFRMTNDVDGIVRVYSISVEDQKSNWSINWASSTDACDPKGICGLNGYCTLMDQQVSCKCIPGFNFIDESRQNLGCKRADDCGIESQNSNNSMYTLDYTIWEYDEYSILSFKTEGECKEACLEDVNYEAVWFKDQECRKQKLPLIYGRRVIDTSITTSLTYVKVSKSCVLNTPSRGRISCTYITLQLPR